MSIILSHAMVLSATPSNPLNTPIIGWHSLASISNVTATTEDPNNPATNVVNPATPFYWSALPASPQLTEYLTFAVNAVDPIDYIAISGHNLGTIQATVSVEGYTEVGGSPELPQWVELVQECILSNDAPKIFRWTPQALLGVRLKIVPQLGTPRIAVAYCGKLTVLERGTHTDHIPINDGMDVNVVNGQSESGHFLGRITTTEGLSTTFAIKQLTESWYTSQGKAFIHAANRTRPFFFAWSPQRRPGDVGYCWLQKGSSIKPVVEFVTQRREFTMNVGGFAL